MKLILTALTVMAFGLAGFSQIVIKRQHPVTNPLEDSLVRSLAGFGIAISNISSNLSPTCKANGTFRSIGNFPIKSGVIMTTGQCDTVAGSNNGPATSVTISPGDTVAGTSIGRQMLHKVLKFNGSNSLPTNVSTIKLDLVPIGDSLKFNYIFASEEYNSFVCSNFNDVFGFFIKGAGIQGDEMFNGTPFEGYRNIAIIPGTPLPVSINTLNNGQDPDPDQLCNITPEGVAAFVDNTDASSPLYDDLKFNGMSVRLTASTPTVACTPYTLVLAISDVYDGSYDSGVFLESGSMVSGDYCSFMPFASNDMNDTITSCQPGKLIFKRCSSHVNDKWTIRFKNVGTAINNFDFKARAANGELVNVPDSIILSPGMAMDSIMLEPIGTENAMKKIVFKYQNLQAPFINGQPNFMPGTTELVLMPNVKIAGRDITRCWFDTGRFQSQFLNLPHTSYQWLEFIDGQLQSSSHLSCSDCPNPVFMMDSSNRTFVVKTLLANTTCERVDTVNVEGLKFLPPVYNVTETQISVVNPQPGYTYTWSINGVQVPGTNITAVDITPSDSVNLLVAAPNGCSAGYQRYQMISGAEERVLEQTGFVVYPIPAAGEITVRGKKAGEAIVEVFDIMGRLRTKTEMRDIQIRIATNTYPNGEYVIRITNRNGNTVHKRLLVNRK